MRNPNLRLLIFLKSQIFVFALGPFANCCFDFAISSSMFLLDTDIFGRDFLPVKFTDEFLGSNALLMIDDARKARQSSNNLLWGIIFA